MNKGKRIFIAVIACLMAVCTAGCGSSKKTEAASYDSISNDKKAWWFQRNENHEPSGADMSIPLADYDAYYYYQPEDETDQVMYFTFDCGYENGFTEEILDILKRQEVKACFFVTQTYIRDNVEIVKRMKEEGHLVGNHTIHHPSMPDKSISELDEEINGCAEYMKEATGYDMDPYLRPPCGEYSQRTLAYTMDQGYKTIFWSMAFLDYDVNNQPGSEYVVNHFNKYHHSGAIVLLHNVSQSDTEALETVLVNMREAGYRFGTLDELD